MLRFKRQTDFLKNDKLEYLTESQRLILYKKKYHIMKHFDIFEWKGKKKGSHNRFKYLFSHYNIFMFWLKVFIRWLQGNEGILYANGVHLVSGYMGAGKTLLSNIIINNVDSSKYFFYADKQQYSSENVYYLPIDKLFKDNKQVCSIPTKDKKGRHLYGIIFDEINRQYNRRLNRTKDYNNSFIGLVEFIVTSRHQGIPRIYFLGQKMELQDTQIISLIEYYHFIKKTTKKYNFQFYKENGYLEKKPRKIKMIHFLKDENNEFYEWKKEKVKVNRYNWGTYNTHALADEYKSLPAFNKVSSKKA